MNRNIILGLCLLGLSVAGLQAATLSSSENRSSLLQTEELPRWSFGANFEFQQRNVSLERRGAATLESAQICGYLGFDVLSWLTLFGTAGADKAKFNFYDDYGKFKFKWSGGIGADLWHFDIYEPTFLEGRCTLKAIAEYAQLRSSLETEDLQWSDLSGALTINYEVFSEDEAKTDLYPYSIVFFVGPALSRIEGTSKGLGFDEDFSQEHYVGVVGGVEIFAAYNLSLGAHVQYYDNTTVSADLRYHF